MRMILYTGKGGVGKTSVTAATAIRLAEMGYRTLAMSVDPAHSLADSFDLDRRLMDHGEGRPVQVRENLHLQEILIHAEVERHWSVVYGYIAKLLKTSGVDGVAAEELAIFPGMEEICGLLYINQYLQEQTYDVVLLDCAPTGESLRFVSIPTTLEWYMAKVFKMERRLASIARPVIKKVSTLPIPEDNYFSNIEYLFERLQGIDAALRDSSITTVRLVTNPEKMVLKETQRAFMYFCLYGLTIDGVVINRILPPDIQGEFMESWRALQQGYLEDIESFFSGVPIWRIPLFQGEVVGESSLKRLADALYGDGDPSERHAEEAPIRFEKVDETTHLYMRLPFVKAEDIELSAFTDELVVQIGNFKRHVSLPRSLAGRKPSGAKRKGDLLDIAFD